MLWLRLMAILCIRLSLSLIIKKFFVVYLLGKSFLGKERDWWAARERDYFRGFF